MEDNNTVTLSVPKSAINDYPTVTAAADTNPTIVATEPTIDTAIEELAKQIEQNLEIKIEL